MNAQGKVDNNIKYLLSDDPIAILIEPDDNVDLPATESRGISKGASVEVEAEAHGCTDRLTDYGTCPTDRGSEGEQLAYSLTQLTGSVHTAPPPHSPHPDTLTFLLVRRNNQQSVSGSALSAARVFTLLRPHYVTVVSSRERM